MVDEHSVNEIVDGSRPRIGTNDIDLYRLADRVQRQITPQMSAVIVIVIRKDLGVPSCLHELIHPVT